MPLTVNVGLSKKLGLPNYGSVGASCHVEFELESSLLQNNLEGFHRHVRNAYVACRQAVQDELARYSEVTRCSEDDAPPTQESAAVAGDSAVDAPRRDGHAAGRASQKQIDYLRQLARQIRGVGVRRLDEVATRWCGKPIAMLTSFEASSLIDTLKAVKAGESDLDVVFRGDRP
ncbi:MAG TPA: hypothetical protein EYP56_07200 [Planctomycetaceae bacterium]|nr:hypothetical protein [Planctomycetaceae bacterium]HIQ20514.1 hypothetical protein [Planctomycetota bacterium]